NHRIEHQSRQAPSPNRPHQSAILLRHSLHLTCRGVVGTRFRASQRREPPTPRLLQENVRQPTTLSFLCRGATAAPQFGSFANPLLRSASATIRLLSCRPTPPSSREIVAKSIPSRFAATAAGSSIRMAVVPSTPAARPP